MKKEIVFKQFEYSIPSAAKKMSAVKKEYINVEHLPLMELVIDFENSKLKLSGCWDFMMAYNKHNSSNWFNYHNGRVQIETSLYVSLPINLSDPETDGLVFAMDGVIKDGNWISSCSGLLILDKITSSNTRWLLSLYLYGLEFSDYEIKFKLPVYLNPLNEMDN